MMQNLWTRSELFKALDLADRAISKGLKQLNEAGLFSFSGKNAANGKPEKLYKLEDLPKRWQKRLTSPQTPLQNGEGLKSGDEIARNELNREVAGSEKRPTENRENGQLERLASMPDRLTRNITTKPLEEAHKQEQKQESDDPAARQAAFGSSVTGLPAGIGDVALRNNDITILRHYDIKRSATRYGGVVKENQMLACVAFIEGRGMGVTVEEAIKEAKIKFGVSRSTCYNWLRAVKGAPDEENGQVKDITGEVIDFKVKTHTTCSDAIEFMVGTFLQNQRVTKQLIIERTIEKANKEGWRVGSKPTLYGILANIIKQIAPALVLKNGGTTAFTKSVAPLMKRDLLSYNSLEVIVGDQHIWDYFIQHEGKVYRPECYVFVDMGSRMIVGFKMTLEHYNSMDVASALYEACRFGIPEAIYTDMGKPELSKYVEQMCRNLEGLCTFTDFGRIDDMQIPGMEDLVKSEGAEDIYFNHVQHLVAIGRRPNSKPIEGYFSIIERKMKDVTGGVGYAKKVDDPDENLRLIAAAEKLKKNGGLLTLDEFMQCVFKVFSWWNEHLISTDKIIPYKRFFANLEQHPRPVPDDYHFDFMLLPEKEVSVRSSQISVNGFVYYHHELSRYSSNYAKNKKVLVKFHPDDPERVHIYDAHTKEYLGMPEIVNKINPKDPEQVAKGMETQKHLQKLWRNFIDKYEPKGESLKVKQVTRAEMMAVKAERQEDVKRIVKESKKRMSQKEADELFLNGGKVG